MATTTSLRRWGTVLVAALVGPAALIAACSNDNTNPQPPTTVYTVPDSGQPPIKSDDAGAGIDAVSPPDDSSTGPNPDAPLTQKDGALVGDAASCASDGGCWSCTPATPTEFLNQCTSSQCSPFSNTTRLPNYDGGLPPLN